MTPAGSDESEVPLCVDLDGTLIRSDILWESLLFVVRESPRRFPALFASLSGGRAAFKAAISQQVEINYALLPWRTELLEWIKAEKNKGRKIYLTTAATKKEADGVAAYLGIFDGVFASDETDNIKGSRKAEVLVERFGESGFEYVGDAQADMPVWKSAQRGICVNAKLDLRAAGLSEKVVVQFESANKPLKVLCSSLRVHQWTKNALVFLPLFASHSWQKIDLATNSCLAALGLCFLASFVYLLNDLVDIDADRRNIYKSKRPLADARLSIPHAFVIAACMLGLTGLCVLVLPGNRMAVAGIYAVYLLANVAYSFGLKKQPGLDILFLTGFYLLRIWLGGSAAGINISIWLLGFAMFIFSSLAFLKRYTETLPYVHKGADPVNRRGYQRADIQFLMAWGIASAACSLLVLVLYMRSPEVTILYRRPEYLLILLPAIYYWLMRMWLIGGRGEMHEDPIVFALRDTGTYFIMLGCVVVAILAI